MSCLSTLYMVRIQYDWYHSISHIYYSHRSHQSNTHHTYIYIIHSLTMYITGWYNSSYRTSWTRISRERRLWTWRCWSQVSVYYIILTYTILTYTRDNRDILFVYMYVAIRFVIDVCVLSAFPLESHLQPILPCCSMCYEAPIYHIYWLNPCGMMDYAYFFLWMSICRAIWSRWGTNYTIVFLLLLFITYNT